ncbi:uncharacterized protein LOC129275211 [Lytechinus pictus]|uniref:uncharacterized protein LOC129275211 n=1 Tax=Lytechinus pictus TaxID=7653 RepID=UPI0030B9B786
MSGTVVMKLKLALLALVLLFGGLYFLQFAVSVEVSLWQRILSGILGVACVLMAIPTTWMTTLRISYGHSLHSAYTQVILNLLLIHTRHRKVKGFIESWKNPRITQENYLREILKANGQTVYAMDFGLSSVTSMEGLRRKHPLATYERYRPYVDRMAKGEEGVLTAERVERFALSSGTTGRSKMMPFTKSFRKMYNAIVGLSIDLRLREFGIGFLQREMTIHTAPKVRYSEAGILMGPASMKNASNRHLLSLYSSPAEAFRIKDPHDSVYVHLLFGFRDRNLRIISCNFTTNLLSAFRTAEQRWRDIVKDIELGTVTVTKVSPDIHHVLVRKMGGGDPKRATELKREFEKGFKGIMKRAWPHLKHVQAIDSSGLKESLLNSYAKGVPIFGFIFAATEGTIGVNIWPKQIGKDEYVLLPSLCLMEFIPETHINEDQPETLFIDELKVGGVYEIVVTQMYGFYRLRYGDVIRVTRYHHNTPVVEFMYRSGQILDVHGEKVDQITVQSSLQAAVGHFPNVTLGNYAVAESTLLDCLVKPNTDLRDYYIIFLELNPTPNEDALADIPLKKVDEELCHHSFTYNSFREKGSIAPPLVHIVKPGTFDRLHDFILDNSTTSTNQYKVPRKLRSAATLKLMLENSIKSTVDQ